MKLPRAFCITLPESPARTESARKHFIESGLPDVTFIDGINAEAFGLRTVFPYEVDNPGSGFNMGPKPTGIWLSHYMLWQILLQQPDSHFLVLEDDAKFQPGWKEKAEKALVDVPQSFDYLFLGSCCTGGRVVGRKEGMIHDVHYPLCSHAHIIAKKALKHMLATTRKCYAPIDIHLTFHTFRELEVYTVLPRIVDQFNTEFPD